MRVQNGLFCLYTCAIGRYSRSNVPFPFPSVLQGLMFGYATDETEQCMPLTVVLSHQLNKKIADLRRDGTLWWARPDSKTQVRHIRSLVNVLGDVL